MSSPVLLVADGTNLAHRCWHASKGRADVAELAKMVLGMVHRRDDRHGATHHVVAFDGPDASAPRRALYPAYKAGRKPPDPQFVTTLLWLPEALAAAGEHVIAREHVEADDVLAAYAARIAAPPRVLLTADKDALALLALPGVRILRPTPTQPWELLTASDLDTYGDIRVPPRAYALYAALRGDKSDNIPGVTGIGPILATELARELVTVENFLDDLTPANARTSRRIAPIVGPARYAKLAGTQEAIARTTAELQLAYALTRPLDVTDLPILDDLEPDAPPPPPPPPGPPCAHGMPGGDRPDPFVFGRLSCPQCALEVRRRRRP